MQWDSNVSASAGDLQRLLESVRTLTTELRDEVQNRDLVQQHGACLDFGEVIWLDGVALWVSIKSVKPALMPMAAAARRKTSIVREPDISA